MSEADFSARFTWNAIFGMQNALEGYILTQQARAHLERLADGFTPNSGHPAWRITGDYGSGKSSFALLLTHLFAGNLMGLPPNLRAAIDFDDLQIAQPRLFPILVTGTNEPIAVAILRSTRDALLNVHRGMKSTALGDEIGVILASSGSREIADDVVLEVLNRANEVVSSSRNHTGLLLILDELGRFLDYAAMHPDMQGVGLLQSLAEMACRSGKRPLFLIGLLHQGFAAYSELLSASTQRDWEKVAGRFEEILFHQPLDQTALLVADAINVNVKYLPQALATEAKCSMQGAIDLGWYRYAPAKQALLEIAPKLYPLHPTTLPLLVGLFSRFGQNERSLFSFLLSAEEYGLQMFARQPLEEA